MFKYTAAGQGYAMFLVRRKVDRDNKIILKIPQMQGTVGNKTQSSDGFLIPNDFSLEQKTRVANIIQVLKGNDLFG